MDLNPRSISFGILAGLLISVLSVQAKPSDPKEPSPSILQARSAPQQPTKSENKSSNVKKSVFQTVLEEILERFKRKAEKGVTRGNVCAIAPGLLESLSPNPLLESPIIFSDRPLFAWQGRVSQIEVQDYETEEILKVANITPGQTTWQYSGPSLHAGQSYRWTLKLDQELLMSFKEFTVMPEEDRKLTQLALASHSNSGESGRLAQADYFVTQSLWSDALTTLHGETDDEKVSIIHDNIETLSQQLCLGESDIEIAEEPIQ